MARPCIDKWSTGRPHNRASSFAGMPGGPDEQALGVSQTGWTRKEPATRIPSLYGDLAMRLSSQLVLGRLSHCPAPRVGRPQSGGKRPPGDSNRARRARATSARKAKSLRDWLRLCGTVAASMTVAAGIASAQPASPSLPNLSGTYTCVGDNAICGRMGATFTVTQSGLDLEIRNEKGEADRGKLTSSTTISAGPVSGVISARDKSSLLWSNGTIWRKQ